MGRVCCSSAQCFRALLMMMPTRRLRLNAKPKSTGLEFTKVFQFGGAGLGTGKGLEGTEPYSLREELSNTHAPYGRRK